MYHLAIRKNATGEVRMCEQDLEWGEGSLFWWLDGNMGCDCNRELCFEQAGGVCLEIDDVTCSDGRFTALYAELPDGSKINLEGVLL